MNHAVLCCHRTSFDNRKEISLDAFSGHVRAVSAVSACNFVNLIQKNNSVLLDLLDRMADDLVHIHKVQGLFLSQNLQGFRNRYFAPFFAFGHHAAEHVLKIDAHFLQADIGKDLNHRHGPFRDVEVHVSIVKPAFPEHLAQFFSR